MSAIAVMHRPRMNIAANICILGHTMASQFIRPQGMGHQADVRLQVSEPGAELKRNVCQKARPGKWSHRKNICGFKL